MVWLILSRCLQLVAVIGLCLLLVFDGSRYAPQVLYEHRQQAMPSQLYLIARQGSQAALSALTQYGREQSGPYWLKLAGGMGDNNAFYQLALRQQDKSAHRRWLSRAARAGHARAQYDLALLTAAGQRQQHWLRQSADQGYVPALMTLAQWHLLHEQFEQARPLLQKAAPQDGESGFILARLYWRQGRYEKAQHWFSRSAGLGFEKSQQYLKLIKRSWRQPARASASDISECAMKLQPVATSLDTAYRLKTLITRMQSDKRLDGLPMCSQPLVWLPADNVSCDANWQGSGRLGCDEALLAKSLTPLSSELSHVIVMAEQGKANVHNGIMYLDLADTYSVLVHELAHFVGFVDEYPLAEHTAQQVCREGFVAPNVLIKPLETEAPESAKSDASLTIPKRWQRLTSDWSLSPTRTCDNHPNQAYKLVSKMTFLEFHDVNWIPPVYLEIWQQRLSSKQGVIPAYVNFAQAMEQQRQWQAADHWRQLARIFTGAGSESKSSAVEAAKAPE